VDVKIDEWIYGVVGGNGLVERLGREGLIMGHSIDL